jgi:hypothetical protein
VTVVEHVVTLLNSLSIADLVELRRLRKQREGIDITKLNKGDIKKKRKKATEDEAHYGLHPGVAQTKQPIENEYVLAYTADSHN